MRPLALFLTVAAAVIVAIPIGLMATGKLRVVQFEDQAKRQTMDYRSAMERLINSGAVESIKCANVTEVRLPGEHDALSSTAIELIRTACSEQMPVSKIEFLRPSWQPIETVY